MKQSTIVKLYEILDQLNIAGVKAETQKAVLKNIRSFKPVYESYVDEVKSVQSKLKPENFDELERKVNAHNEAVKADCTEGRLSEAEAVEVGKVYDAYNESIRQYIEELNETELDLNVRMIEEDEYYKLVNQNDSKIEAGKFALLMDLIDDQL